MTDSNCVIHTEGLTKLYGKQRGILDIDLDIVRGEVFGYLGPNGAGKTTTIRTLLLIVVFWAALAISGAIIDMGLNLFRLAAVCFSGFLLAITFGTIALAVGCARGKRGVSLGVGGALAVYAYFLNALAPLIEWLEPFQVASPFYYYIDANPLSNGLDPVHAAMLIGLTVIFLVIAIVTFERRDLAV